MTACHEIFEALGCLSRGSNDTMTKVISINLNTCENSCVIFVSSLWQECHSLRPCKNNWLRIIQAIGAHQQCLALTCFAYFSFTSTLRKSTDRNVRNIFLRDFSRVERFTIYHTNGMKIPQPLFSNNRKMSYKQMFWMVLVSYVEMCGSEYVMV